MGGKFIGGTETRSVA